MILILIIVMMINIDMNDIIWFICWWLYEYEWIN